MSTGGNHSCFLLRQEELTRHGLVKMLRGVEWGDCSLCRWQSWDVLNSLLKSLPVWSGNHTRWRPGSISQPVDSTCYYFEFYKTVGIGVGKEWCPPFQPTLLLWIPAYWGYTGADEQELATPTLSLCHGIFTDWSIFSTPFLSWKKRSSGPVTQWRQLVSCYWLWLS